MKYKIKDNYYFRFGLMLFITFSCLIVFYFLLLKFDLWCKGILKVIKILSPIWLGLLFAYLMNPFVKLIEDVILKKVKVSFKLKRLTSITTTILVLGLMILLFIKFVVPSLFSSVQMIVKNLPEYNEHIYNLVDDHFELSRKDFDRVVTKITNYINEKEINTNRIMNNIASASISFVGALVNVTIGIIVAVYLLYDKEEFKRNTKAILKASLSKKVYQSTMDTLVYADKIFGDFLIAKIIDSLIIGVLTFVLLSIFKIPYSIVISLIIGITNIIPYFGPIIGAIPCIIFLLLISPTKAIVFTILILLIQQFDGNILGPKLIGHKIGMKSFWVLFSILLFGGLFGVPGMIFGVPFFALISSIFGTKIEKKLLSKSQS